MYPYVHPFTVLGSGRHYGSARAADGGQLTNDKPASAEIMCHSSALELADYTRAPYVAKFNVSHF